MDAGGAPAHAPHVEGLSQRGRMWVYVNAGTGTWGPPVRLGTRPELTLLRLTAGGRSGEPGVGGVTMPWN